MSASSLGRLSATQWPATISSKVMSNRSATSRRKKSGGKVGRARARAEPDVRERSVLLSACQLADAAAVLRAAMVGVPTFTEGSHGQIVMHPGYQELQQTYKEMAALLFRIDLEPLDDGAGGGIIGITLTPATRM